MFAQEHRQKLEIQIVDAQVKANKNWNLWRRG